MTGGGHLACALPRAAVSGEGEKRVPRTRTHTYTHAGARTHAQMSIRRVDRRVDTGFNRSVLKRKKKKEVTGTMRRTQGATAAAEECLG